MTDGTAGWFRDPNDETLARWHDGKSWTEHTLVIADQPPGVEPAPPQIPDPEPEVDDEPAFTLPRRPAAASGGLPGWFKVAGPLAVVALLVVAFTTLSGDDDPSDETTTAETVTASLDDAVDAARDAGLSDAVTDARAAALIERICAAAERPTAVDELGEDLGSLPASDPSDLRRQVSALGAGAAERCPDDLDDAPGLIEELQDLAVAAVGTSTTLSPDVAAVDGGTDAGATDAGDGADGGGSGFDDDDRRPRTSTTAGRRTTTTRRPSTGGTTATTAAPATTTTVRGVLRNSSCSTAGATARDKVSGGTLTCQKACATNRLQWRSGPCPTNPPPPTTAPGTPPPTAPPSTAGP